mgnify:CR=1 FL=1
MNTTATNPIAPHLYPRSNVHPAYQEALTVFGVTADDYSWTDTARKVFDHKGKGGHSKGGGKKATHYPKDKKLPPFKCRYMSQNDYTAVKKYLKKQGLI